MIPRVVELWTDRAENKNLEWVITVDDGSEECRASAEAVKSKYPGVTVLVNKGAKNCVAGWNLAASATTGKVIIAVSDDFAPPNLWDRHLLSLSPVNWVDEDRVVHVNDGYVRTLCTLAIMTRTRYERYGYLWYPGYESLFCDTEFTEAAYSDGVVIEAMHLLFEHMHPDCQKRSRDQADLVHASKDRWNRGEMLFNFRKQHGFPVDAGPKAVIEQRLPPPPSKRKYCAYLQVTQDDFCLYEVCVRLREEGVNDFFFCIPDEYWDGRKTPINDIKQVAAITQRLHADGATISTKMFKVADYRYPNDTRIDTETRLRNDSLTWIRSNGFEHVLIVDGDELWLAGTLEIVDQLVSAGHLVVSSAMIPTIGLPGYPIDQATDLAVVYIGSKCQFKACRTPFVRQQVISIPRVIHFTATRRTMDEIITKHRASGHYDDPDYDFEGWIKNVLPNVKPGFKGAHMYKKFQIWPQVRNWRPEEVRQIPESLHQFLGIQPVPV